MREVKAKKFLGQHFLTDLSVARRIADTVDACPEIPVLEVGPGMGVMTQFLMQKPRELKVVELDYESVEYLRRKYPDFEDNIIEDDFLKMLHLLFRARLKAEEKTKRLKDDFNIVLDNEMRKELNIMCNLSEGIAEEARAEAWAEANKLSAGIAEEAMEEGRKLGFKDGKDATTTEHLKNIMHNTQVTLEEAMDMLGIPEGDRSQYTGLV